MLVKVVQNSITMRHFGVYSLWHCIDVVERVSVFWPTHGK